MVLLTLNNSELYKNFTTLPYSFLFSLLSNLRCPHHLCHITSFLRISICLIQLSLFILLISVIYSLTVLSVTENCGSLPRNRLSLHWEPLHGDVFSALRSLIFLELSKLMTPLHSASTTSSITTSTHHLGLLHLWNL